jgi:DNA repair protein RadC
MAAIKKETAVSIKNWPKDERPREKLLRHGERKLSNPELLAILIRDGFKGRSALDLARMISSKFKTFHEMAKADLSSWQEFKGLGAAKISQIKAAIEIGRRYTKEIAPDKAVKISSSKDAADILMPELKDLVKEVFKIMLLNSQNKIIDIIEITEGTVNQANPIVREIFQKALQNHATAIICVHNHPAGDCNPSIEDKAFTKNLLSAGNALQIKVLDHIIIGGANFFSFADSKMLNI